MSCTYADGLSPYENKGVLGVPEKFDNEAKIQEKCNLLTTWILNAKHVVVHTGAGISTAAGIPDFRGPNGVWTLEKQGVKPTINVSFNEAIPTKTHMALKHLVDKKYVHYIISQNIDGLHLRTGLKRDYLAELHGNMFIGQCDTCESQFVLKEATVTVGQKSLGQNCKRGVRGRYCRGKLNDTILDWEAGLPEKDLDMSIYNSSIADLNICLGTTLQIVPSGNLPLKCKKYGGKLVIINLQPTKHDKKADLIINTYVDTVLEKVMKQLSLEIPEYTHDLDPTKYSLPHSVLPWEIMNHEVKAAKKKFDEFNKEFKKRRLLDTQNGVVKKRTYKKKLRYEIVCDKKLKKEDNSASKVTKTDCVVDLTDEDDVKKEEKYVQKSEKEKVNDVQNSVKKTENNVQKHEKSGCVDLTLSSDDDLFME